MSVRPVKRGDPKVDRKIDALITVLELELTTKTLNNLDRRILARLNNLLDRVVKETKSYIDIRDLQSAGGRMGAAKARSKNRDL